MALLTQTWMGPNSCSVKAAAFSIASASAYYPFGMDMPTVKWDTTEYLATMEAANEAARAAVNGILDACGDAQARCAIRRR